MAATIVAERAQAAKEDPKPSALWTVGHSSRTMQEFVGLLQSEHVERLADVRRYAGSRAHPHFNPDPFSAALSEHGVDYVAFPELGGRRAPLPASHNTVWRNAAFRGYADYMETAEYRAGIDRLRAAAARRRTALLCAEAVWWRCHRALIADDLKTRGIPVRHIMAAGRVVEHPLTSAARVVQGKLSYRP